MEAEKANFPVALMCEVLEVSRSGYYAWSKRPPATRTQENQQLKEQIKEIHQKSRNSYGAPRIHAALKQEGFEVGRHRVARLMSKLGICVQPKRKFKTTTDSNHSFPTAENVLNRNFTTQEPDQAWVADITYIPTQQGWLYLAVVIDLFSRRVVGWSMADHMRVELVLNALEAALGHRVPATSGLLFHSDRGSQYASSNYRAALQKAGIGCSMSRKGNCWDNAVAESFFGTLKTELIKSRVFDTTEKAKSTIVEWIEVFYNRERLHSTLHYLPPVQFEEQYWASQRQSTAA
ncbi:MAG: IS3 family transposase [Leptolyngbyaceae cyanobacterium]